MNAKQYLSQLKCLDARISQKLQELSYMQNLVTAINASDYTKDRVQTSPGGEAPYVSAAIRIVELNEEINIEIDRFVNTKHRIINEIQEAEDERYIKILFLRYVEFMTLKEIAQEMGYSYDRVKHLHRDSLKDFESRLDS